MIRIVIMLQAWLLCAALSAAYDMAKRIIHLVVKVGDLINKDPETRDLLRLYFLPDYNVSLAEVIIPGGRRQQH
jgi:starch phosphorylase